MQKHQELSQDQCRKRIEEAFVAQQVGELSNARSLLEQAREIDPAHAETWWNLAELSIQEDNYERAVEELTRYIELQENDPHAHLRLAQLYYLQNEYELAQESLKEVIRRIPNNIDALMLSARLARKQGEPQQALTHYYHVLQVSPNQIEATLELSEMLLTRQESVRAASILRSLAKTELAPDDWARKELNLGVAYGQLSRWDDAVEHLELAQRDQDHHHARDQYRLAYAHYRAGTSQQALEVLLDLADSHHWDRRAELLFATITETNPKESSVIMTASLLTEPIPTERFSSSGLSELTLTTMESQKIEEPIELQIIPPEWRVD